MHLVSQKPIPSSGTTLFLSNNMQTLSSLRTQIDALDREILALFGKRFEAIREVGSIKKKEGIIVLQANRWAEVQSNIKKLARENNIPENCVIDIYNVIHKYALIEEEK